MEKREFLFVFSIGICRASNEYISGIFYTLIVFQNRVLLNEIKPKMTLGENREHVVLFEFLLC